MALTGGLEIDYFTIPVILKQIYKISECLSKSLLLLALAFFVDF